MPKLGVVIFGASTYDNHSELNNPRFANSAKQFIKTISNPEIMPDCSVKSLDLYDEPTLPSEILVKITDFVSEDFDDVIIYYCGHGDVSRAVGEYRVFLRKSKRDLRHATMLDVVGLIRDVERISFQKTIYFVLDACYSGSVISQEFMDAGGGEALIDRSLFETVTRRGIAVFAATSGLDVALAKKGDKLSLFTGAFVRCLNEGIPYKRDVKRLSWLEVRDEIVRSTRDRLGPDAPVPKITTLDEKFGDITRVPFFVNRAYVLPEKRDVSTEELYWRNLPDDPPISVLHDFVAKFPDGIFAPLARALADKQISRATEAELEEYLRYHPKTKFKQQITARLTTLKRDHIQKSTDVAALEQIVGEKPESEFANEAKQRIDALRRKLAETEARERLEASTISNTIPKESEPFLRGYPDDRFYKRAKTRLAAAISSVTASVLSPRDNWRRYIAVAALLLLVGAGALLMAGGNSSVSIEAFRKDLDAAGSDPVKLRSFIDRCSQVSCSLMQDAGARLANAEAAGAAERTRPAQIETDRRELDAAGTDIGRLRAFVDRCKATSCPLAQDAATRLANAEATAAAERARLAQIETDRREFDAAGTDIGKLRAFVSRCKATSCSFAQDAGTRLANAEAAAERARLAQIETDRRELDAAGTDIGKLRAFVSRCKATSCSFAQDAGTRLANAEAAAAAERARLAQIETDRRELDAAGTDIGRLRAFVSRCKATSCSFAQDAGTRLANAEAAEAAAARARPESTSSFNTFLNYDIAQNDIEIIPNISHADCAAKCPSTDGCVAYIFDKWKNSCYLKNKVGPLVLDPRYNAVIRTDQPWPVLATSKIETCSYHNSAMIGDVSRSFNAQSAPECRSQCEVDQSCVAFTFRKTDSRCNFFTSVSDRKRGEVTSESGARMQNPC